MSTDQAITEALAEDAEEREVHRYDVVVMLSEAGGKISYDPHGPEIVMASAYDELRQQLADVTNERDALRASQQWVSIKDRMPEVDQLCLIRMPVCGRHNVENGKYSGFGKWVGAWCSNRGKDECYRVSHWMPLPFPPTEEVSYDRDAF